MSETININEEMILEPQMVLESVEGDTVTCKVSPEWKQHLVDFLDYVQGDGREDVYIEIPEYETGLMRDEIAKQTEGNKLVVPNYYFSFLSSIFTSFGHLPNEGIYKSPPIFCRLHDDVRYVRRGIYGDLNGKLRLDDLKHTSSQKENS